MALNRFQSSTFMFGNAQTGRRLTAPEKTPLCNLYRTMMQRMRVEVDQFGTSTGIVDLA